MQVSDIRPSLRAAGIIPGDTLMIHGDAIVAAQLSDVPSELKLAVFFQEIMDYLGSDGTLIVPTFSYSFTRFEVFDVANSASRVGLFSEIFRQKFSFARTRHPIFSVVAVGRHQNLFMSSSISDCFGEGTVFHTLHKLNAKLMNLGCDLMLTFTHYIEQKFEVSYRYFKIFSGNIIDGEQSIHDVECRYYVGDLNIDYSLNLNRLKDNLLLQNSLKIVPFGRVASYTVDAASYDRIATEMLIENEYSLIQEGYGGKF